jgi:hypothetical protein
MVFLLNLFIHHAFSDLHNFCRRGQHVDLDMVRRLVPGDAAALFLVPAVTYFEQGVSSLEWKVDTLVRLDHLDRHSWGPMGQRCL